ncbi:MAG: dihydrodipicolinate synthase family protein [Sediminibacterium sp.]|nr:dihydrodipicolinate synthase family protein [Sediminibacterium sp.]
MNWAGVFPALTTKFTQDNRLDLALQAKNTNAQIAAGVHGVILAGSLGEASTITESEKEILLKSTLEVAADRIPVLLNIAEGSTDEAIKQAQNAEKWGAQAIMLLPPMRYKSDHRETVHFFKQVATNSNLPIMIYNNPIDYKIEVTIEMFAELIDCKNIQATKESTRDVSNVSRLKSNFGDRIKILCGVDTIASEELIMGADGWVAGLCDAFPVETVAIYNFIKSNQFEKAIEIHRWFLPLLELDLHPKLVQYIKLAESMVGIGSEFVRGPRLTLEGAERTRIMNIINKSLANRPTIN